MQAGPAGRDIGKQATHGPGVLKVRPQDPVRRYVFKWAEAGWEWQGGGVSVV